MLGDQRLADPERRDELVHGSALGGQLVQPCDLDRQPQGTAIGIGPVLTDADAAAVADWLAGGSLDATRLEPRLRLTSRPDR